MAVGREPVYYWSYLHLDQLLSAQEPLSDPPAHDELLFIVVHQAFELWFKQILFELDDVLAVMGQEVVAEKDMGEVVSHLQRITKIQRLLTDQIDVLETMTPLDFLEFRDVLIPASGFQSVQFRLIENKLGLDTGHRLRIKGMRYTSVLSGEHAGALEASEGEPSLHDHLERWLRRTPFLSFGGFDFWRAYREAVAEMMARDRAVVESHPQLDDEARAAALAEFDATMSSFEAVFDANKWAELVRAGKRRLSHRAFLAALLINLYRDEPIFQLPFRFLTTLIDIDEGFTTWRQRHVLLAHRMIGSRIGTGGTAGHEYLAAAARRHRVFTDLFDLPTFFIPRSSRPPLPAEVAEQMGFRFGTPSAPTSQ
jgi:tryptophan 2,3-dioxygenase